jgi:hypothetical protein
MVTMMEHIMERMAHAMTRIADAQERLVDLEKDRNLMMGRLLQLRDDDNGQLDSGRDQAPRGAAQRPGGGDGREDTGKEDGGGEGREVRKEDGGPSEVRKGTGWVPQVEVCGNLTGGDNA